MEIQNFDGKTTNYMMALPLVLTCVDIFFYGITGINLIERVFIYIDGFFVSPDLPQNIQFCGAINVTNEDKCGISNYYFAISAGTIAIASLAMSTLGLFVTLEMIAVSNFRSQFYQTTLFYLDNKSNYLDRKTIKKIEEIHEKLCPTTVDLFTYNRYFVYGTVTFITALLFALILHSFIIGSYIKIIWWLIGLYLSFLLIMVSIIFNKAKDALSYAKLSPIHENIGSKIIKDMKNKLEHDNTTDSADEEKYNYWYG